MTDFPQTTEENKPRSPPQRESPRLFEHIEPALTIGFGSQLTIHQCDSKLPPT
jgi:hypothetical protein